MTRVESVGTTTMVTEAGIRSANVLTLLREDGQRLKLEVDRHQMELVLTFTGWDLQAQAPAPPTEAPPPPPSEDPPSAPPPPPPPTAEPTQDEPGDQWFVGLGEQ